MSESHHHHEEHLADCSSHHEHHEHCGDACACCHGKKKPATWQFVFVLIVIVIVSALIIKGKRTEAYTLESLGANADYYIVLVANSSCGKCKPMVDVFANMKVAPRASKTFWDAAKGEAPFTNYTEPVVFILDAQKNEVGRIENLHSEASLNEELKRLGIPVAEADSHL